MMTVDGSALKSVREKIRSEPSELPPPGHPKRGTQQWLADTSNIAVRSVINLEQGKASIKTLIAVCHALGIPNWKEYIINHGQEYVSCAANKYIDFRPQISPNKQPDIFMNSVMLMTVDPITLLAESGEIDVFHLKEIRANLKGLEKNIPFSWYAEVSLTEGMRNWLGWIKEAEAIEIVADNAYRHIPVMFKQDNVRVSWQEFVTMVERSEKNKLVVELEFQFSHFTKKLDIYACLDCLKGLFEQGRQKYQADWPHRAQLKTILKG